MCVFQLIWIHCLILYAQTQSRNLANQRINQPYSCNNCSSCFAHKHILLDIAVVQRRSFYACHHIRHIMFTDSVRRIENEAFAHSFDLVSVTIPIKNSITFIGDRTFSSCLNLESFEFPTQGMVLAYQNSMTSVLIYQKSNESRTKCFPIV